MLVLLSQTVLESLVGIPAEDLEDGASLIRVSQVGTCIRLYLFGLVAVHIGVSRELFILAVTEEEYVWSLGETSDDHQANHLLGVALDDIQAPNRVSIMDLLFSVDIPYFDHAVFRCGYSEVGVVVEGTDVLDGVVVFEFSVLGEFPGWIHAVDYNLAVITGTEHSLLAVH